MKKVILCLGSIFGIIVMFSSVAYATNSDFSPHVTGYIYDASNNPVSGANVTAACGSSTGSTTSMSSGFYSIDFDNSCVSGSGVNVSASLGSSSGTGTAIMVGSEGRGSVATASVNIELIKVSMVPELSILTGIVAVIIGGGSFFVIRRFKLSNK